jgi:osmotically-inducible protein OsmY
LIATRDIQRVAGRLVEDPDDEAVRLAVRAAIVNQLVTQADGIDVRVVDGEAFLDGTVADRASAARALAAAGWVPYVDRIQSTLRVTDRCR